MSPLADLVRSAHGCIYAYGVIAAYLPEPDAALDAMAAHRRVRDALLNECNRLNMTAPAAALSYDISVTDTAGARREAARIENALCAQWASALPALDRGFALDNASFPVECALRGFRWSGVVEAFPS